MHLNHIPRIRNLKESQVEQILKSMGWTDLSWGIADTVGTSWGKDAVKVLYACPPDYDGEFTDYNESVVVAFLPESQAKKPGIQPLNYRWVQMLVEKKRGMRDVPVISLHEDSRQKRICLEKMSSLLPLPPFF